MVSFYIICHLVFISVVKWKLSGAKHGFWKFPKTISIIDLRRSLNKSRNRHLRVSERDTMKTDWVRAISWFNLLVDLVAASMTWWKHYHLIFAGDNRWSWCTEALTVDPPMFRNSGECRLGPLLLTWSNVNLSMDTKIWISITWNIISFFMDMHLSWFSTHWSSLLHIPLFGIDRCRKFHGRIFVMSNFFSSGIND